MADSETIDTDIVNVRASDDASRVMPPPSNSSIPTTSSRNKRKTSEVWNYFEIYVENNTERTRCKACSKSYAYGSATHGTKNMKRHIQNCPKRANHDVGQLLIDHNHRLQSRKISQETFREYMALSIIQHNYPYSYVENQGTRRVFSYVCNELVHYSRNTAKADCLKIFERMKKKTKLELGRLTSRICLTSDVWTSGTTEGYISLTAHYIDEDWELQNKILNFCHIPPPHSGVVLAENIMNFLQEWGIEKKIFSITLDNASSNDRMEDILRN